MKCPACQTVNAPGAHRCSACEADLPARCTACGNPVEMHGELCASCQTDRMPAALGSDPGPPADAITAVDRLAGVGAPDFDLDPMFVGRTELIERLSRQIAEAIRQSSRTFMAFTGPSGVGKTRLARELGGAVRALLPNVRVFFSICGGPGAPPFAAFARLLAARFGIAEGESSASARQKIAHHVGAVMPPSRVQEISHLLAQLARHPFPESPILEPMAETPRQLESRMFIALRRFLHADSAKSPLVLVLDDAERALPETVNLLHYLAAGLADCPVALIAVGRPDLFTAHPAFGTGDAPLERVAIGPLTADESLLLFKELVRVAGDAPAALDRHAAERIGGSPRALFELVRYLLEAKVIMRSGQAWRFDADRFAAVPLPESLEQLLAARLSIMADTERDLLEKAASTGEIFWLDTLVALIRGAALEKGDPDGPPLAEIAAAGDRIRTEVASTLAVLERRGLLAALPHSTIPGEREYRFAYPPWWEVIYGTIDQTVRKRYHRLVAQWLELRPEGRVGEKQEEIARHLENAGDGSSASQRYRRAAEEARLRYFNDKAVRMYDQALRCLGEGNLASRIQLWHDLGTVHQLRGDHEAALAAFERMLRLAWVVASRTKAAVAFNKMGRIHRQKGDLTLALDYLERGLEFFRQSGDERGVAGSLDDIGQALWLLGRYEQALDRSAEALEKRRRLGDRRSIATSLLNIGHIERHRGLFNEADSCYREALEIRQGLGDRAGIAAALNGLGVLAYQRGDFPRARREWEEALHIAEEIGSLPLEAILESHLGEVARAVGNSAEARTRFERSEAVARDLDDRRLQSEAMRNLGLLELTGGDRARALELCERALAIAEAARIRVDVGRALLALGQVHAATLFDDTGRSSVQAEDYFKRGVALFREIGNEAELATGLERFGAFQIERGDLQAGRQLLTEAQMIFQRLGMRASDSVQRMITELG